MYGQLIDWHRATTKQRRVVYAASRRIITATGMSWAELFRAALGREMAGQADIGHTVTNFRHGKLGRRSVAKISHWIGENFPDEGARIDLELTRAQRAPLYDVLTSDLSPDEINARLASRGKTLNTPVTIADSIFLMTGRRPSDRYLAQRRRDRLAEYIGKQTTTSATTEARQRRASR